MTTVGFQREAAILSILTHDAIVRYLDHGRTDSGTMYLAMEWLEGQDLAKTLAQTRQLSIVDCVRVARRVCAALLAAHQHGFVHRDIKPSNVFLCAYSAVHAKLLDFGVAHRGVTTQTATRAGTLLGTVGYMAPEQVSGATLPDPRDDLFSLGCVLFECITGRPAFLGANMVTVLDAVLLSHPPDVRTLRPETPDALADLVHSLLRKSRAERPANAEAALWTLQKLSIEAESQPLQMQTSPSFGIAVCARGVAREAVEEIFAGAELVKLDDVLLVVLRSHTQLGLVDLAAQAKHGALAVRKCTPQAALWVAAIGYNMHGVPTEELAGRVLARSPELLAQAAGTIDFDAVTSALLRSREDASRLDAHCGASLTHAALSSAAVSVDRSAELSAMEAVLEECKTDDVARTILTTAPAGFGKSRLCREFLLRLQADAHVEALVATALPSEQTKPLALLGAICVANATGEPSGHELEAALSRFQSGAVATLVLCIDDAHCADLASMHAIRDQLDRLRERPWLIVGFARPDMSREHRELWQATSAHSVTLRPLAARAAERCLERAIPSVQERNALITLAGGNPRLLSALAAIGGSVSDVELELASLLIAEQLPPLTHPARNVLSALSMFTGHLPASSVSVLLDDNLDVQQALRLLCENNLLLQRGPLGEYEFVHPSVQSAANRCMPASERIRMRRLAAERLPHLALADAQLCEGL